MIKLADETLQQLPHYWHKLSSDRKIWFLTKCNCSPMLKSYWGILEDGEVELFVNHQTLSPEFIRHNWKHFNPHIKFRISQCQSLFVRLPVDMWDVLSMPEKSAFCKHTDISRAFMIDHWYTLPRSIKTNCFVYAEHGKSLPKGKLVMFLSDSNMEVRKAASKYLNAWIGLRLLWKVAYYLERGVCYGIPKLWRAIKDKYRRS